jgi:hypothetical protein
VESECQAKITSFAERGSAEATQRDKTVCIDGIPKSKIGRFDCLASSGMRGDRLSDNMEALTPESQEMGSGGDAEE